MVYRTTGQIIAAYLEGEFRIRLYSDPNVGRTHEAHSKPNSKGTFLPLDVNSSIFYSDFLLDFSSCDLRNVILSSKEQKSNKKSE